MAEDLAQTPPCRHYADTPPSRCWLPGRTAPQDCVCAAYSEDLAAALSTEPDACEKRAAWRRATGAPA